MGMAEFSSSSVPCWSAEQDDTPLDQLQPEAQVWWVKFPGYPLWPARVILCVT